MITMIEWKLNKFSWAGIHLREKRKTIKCDVINSEVRSTPRFVEITLTLQLFSECLLINVILWFLLYLLIQNQDLFRISLHHVPIKKEIADLRNQLELNSPPPDHPSAAVPRESWKELKEKLLWNRQTRLELIDPAKAALPAILASLGVVIPFSLSAVFCVGC